MLQRIQRHRRTILLWSAHLQREQGEMQKSSYGMDWIRRGIWYGPTKLVNKLSQNVQISDEVINFIEKTMKTWGVELTTEGRSLSEAKIQRGIFQGDALSPLLSIIAMMPFNHILRKCTAGYKLSLSQKINRLLYKNIKLFTKNEKELETLIHS